MSGKSSSSGGGAASAAATAPTSSSSSSSSSSAKEQQQPSTAALRRVQAISGAAFAVFATAHLSTTAAAGITALTSSNASNPNAAADAFDGVLAGLRPLYRGPDIGLGGGSHDDHGGFISGSRLWEGLIVGVSAAVHVASSMAVAARRGRRLQHLAHHDAPSSSSSSSSSSAGSESGSGPSEGGAAAAPLSVPGAAAAAAAAEVRAVLRAARRFRLPPALAVHRLAGYALTALVVMHFSGTRGAELMSGLPASSAVVQYTMRQVWLFNPYYAMLGAAGAYHTVHGLAHAWDVLGPKSSGSAATGAADGAGAAHHHHHHTPPSSSRAVQMAAGVTVALVVTGVVALSRGEPPASEMRHIREHFIEMLEGMGFGMLGMAQAVGLV